MQYKSIFFTLSLVLSTQFLQTNALYDGCTMLKLVNTLRSQNGRSNLCLNSALRSSATSHSNDMAQSNTMQHDGTDGSTPDQRITAAGYSWTGWAENVAFGYSDEASAMSAWESDSGHLANLLGDYTHIGIGSVASSSNLIYATQDFGRSSTMTCDISCDGSTPTAPSDPQGGSTPADTNNSSNEPAQPSTPPTTTSTSTPPSYSFGRYKRFRGNSQDNVNYSQGNMSFQQNPQSIANSQAQNEQPSTPSPQSNQVSPGGVQILPNQSGSGFPGGFPMPPRMMGSEFTGGFPMPPSPIGSPINPFAYGGMPFSQSGLPVL